MTERRTQQFTADQAMSIRLAQVKLLQSKLDRMVKELVQDFERNGSKDWGHVGSLDYVREMLKQSIVHLGDDKPEESK